MARRDGEISPREAAERLEITVDTVWRWCQRARAYARGEELSPGRLSKVRRDVGGRYWLNAEEVARIIAETE